MMNRYVSKVPSGFTRRWMRNYSALLLRPLTRESSIEQVTYRSRLLLNILDTTHDDVLKLSENDYDDLDVMMDKLPMSEKVLYENLTQLLLNAKFVEINSRLLSILLDIIESKQEKSGLLLLVVKQFCGAMTASMSLDLQRRLYETWANCSDSKMQDELLKMPYTNSVIYNLVIQTHLIQGNLLQAEQVADMCLRNKMLLDGYTLELLSYYLLENNQADEVFKFVEITHAQNQNAYHNQFLPLSNQQFGRLLSQLLLRDRYKPMTRLFNKFCYFQKLHYVDQGFLLLFAQAAVKRSDTDQLRRIFAYFAKVDSATFNESMILQMTVLFFESKWNVMKNSTVKRASFATDFPTLGAVPGLKSCDFPLFRAKLIELYPLTETDRILDEILQTAHGDDGNVVGAKLLMNIFIATLSELGKTDSIFELLQKVSKQLQVSTESDTVFYLIRSYYKTEAPLSDRSARFIVELLLKQTGEIDTKLFKLVLKLFATKYEGDKDVLEPVIALVKSQGYSL